MFVENNVMQQYEHAGDDAHLNEDHLSSTLFFCKEYPILTLWLPSAGDSAKKFL